MVKVVGSWRLESHGINAAVELAAFADLMAAAEMSGFKIPIRLRIEERSSQKPGQPRHDYTVPVPEIAAPTPQQLLGAGVTAEEVRALPSGIPEMPRSPIFPGLEREPPEQAVDPDGLSLEAFSALAKEKGVNLGTLNAQARMLEPEGRSLPQITDAERLDLAKRWGLI